MTVQRARNAHLTRLMLSAIAAIIGVGVLVPIVLIRIAGWPLPAAWPQVGETLTAFQQQDVPEEFVVGAVACVAWVIWVQVAWAFLWEAVINTRRIARGLDVRPAPFVAAGINRLVARAASGTVAFSMLVASPATAAPLPTVAPIEALEFQSSIATEANSDGSTQIAMTQSRPLTETRWTVASGDTAWSIAEAALGDGSRFAEIAELNPGLSSPRDVEVGLTLIVPEGAHVPSDRDPADVDEPKTAGGAAQHAEVDPSASVHSIVASEHLGAESRLAGPSATGFVAERDVVIETGDHLWGLSEQRLQAAGADPSDLEILGHVTDVIDLNRDIVENPDLIFPGEVFTFPQIGVDLAPVLEIPPVAATPSDSSQAPRAPLAEEQPVVSDATRVLDQNAVGISANSRSISPYLLGLAGSTVIATSLLAASRRRRHRRAVLGAHLWSEPETELESALTTAANLPLVRWAGQELSALVTNLKVNAAPLAVEVSESGIEILWDEIAAVAPHPWEATDGGVAWRLLYDADAPIPADELAPALPALVTVGVRPNEGTVLLDLEALGSVSVFGDQGAVEDFIRSIVLELATGSDLASADVVTVGFESERDVPRVTIATEDEALDLLTATVAQYDEMIASTGSEHSFALRCATGTGPEAVVVVLAAESCVRVDDFVNVVGRRRGGAVVIVGQAKSSNGSIVVGEDGSTAIEPLGLNVQAPAVTAKVASEAAGLFEPPSSIFETQTEEIPGESRECVEAALAPAEIVEDVANDQPKDDLGSFAPVDLEAAGAELGEEENWERPYPPLTVRLLGEPSVAGLKLSSRQLGLLGLIASKGGEVSAEFVLDHLWADQSNARSRKTLWNLESATRSVVGPEILPHSPKNQPLRTTAVTDVSIFETLVNRSEQVSSSEAADLLNEALDLIQGPPFDNCQFEWARSIGVYEPARQMIEAASLRLSEMALEAGDLERSRRAIAQGLLGLGVSEPLYRLRMRVDAASGDSAAVLHTYGELRDRLEMLFGDAEPSAATKRLRSELMNGKAA